MSEAQPKSIELSEAQKSAILASFQFAAAQADRLLILQDEAQSAGLLFNIECRKTLGELGLFSADGWQIDVTDGEVTLIKKPKEPKK